MSKSKTNALDALRALIAERQQYDQWIATLESKRDGTPEHVFNRVHSDYRSRLDRVLGEIRSHSEELQLSINTLSSRLSEVAKDEEAKRDAVQEAELRAAVGEYDVSQWESMRAESGRELEKIAGDRGSLESQLAELESIRKLSEMTSGSEVPAAPAEATPAPTPTASTPTASAPVPAASAPTPVESAPPSPPPPAAAQSSPAREPESNKESESTEDRPRFSDVGWPARDIVDIPATPASAASPVSAASAPTPTPSQSRRATPSSSQPAVEAKAAEPAPRASMDAAAAAPRPSASPAASPPAPTPPPKRRTPAGKDGQISSGFTKPVPTPPEGRPEVNKTLKCPECGTPNYPTEWYCERCGGELATM